MAAISKDIILERLKKLKYGIPTEISGIIPIREDNRILGYLQVITSKQLDDARVIAELASWRKRANRWFPSQFRVTRKSTKQWARQWLLEKPDRILFFVVNTQGEHVGHMGFYRFDFSEPSCEIDNVIRGIPGSPGLMTQALRTLRDWSMEQLSLKCLYLRVFSDNQRAVELYTRCGFKEVEKIPLRKVIEGDTVRWEDATVKTISKKYFVRMKYSPRQQA